MAQQYNILWGGKSLNALQWQQELQGYGGWGGAGDGVTAYQASAWAMRAVALRASAVAGAPLILRGADGEVIPDHAVLDMLYKVDTEWDYGQLMAQTEASLLTYGSAYWLKMRPSSGARPTQLAFINPANATLEVGDTGITGLRVTTSTGRVRVIPRADIVYFRGEYNPLDPLRGIAPLRYAIAAALGEKHADKYLNAFFQNMATVPLALVTDQSISEAEAERVSARFAARFRGALNAFRVAVFGAGLKPVPMGSTPRDVELPGARAAIHQTISTALGVPELLISPSNSADLTPIKMAQTLFYQNTIAPRWKMLAEVITSQLLSDFSDLRGAWVEFDDSDIAALSEDETSKAQRLALMVQIGALTPQAAGRAMGYADDDIPPGADVTALVERVAADASAAGETDEPRNAPLTGAQIASAVAVLGGVAQGSIAVDAAEVLLTSLGIEPDSVRRMIAATLEQRSSIAAAAPVDIPQIQVRSVGMASDLDRWQRKSLAALARGKSPAVQFESEHISPAVSAALSAALEAAQDESDVRALFSDLFEWSMP